MKFDPAFPLANVRGLTHNLAEVEGHLKHLCLQMDLQLGEKFKSEFLRRWTTSCEIGIFMVCLRGMTFRGRPRFYVDARSKPTVHITEKEIKVHMSC